VGWERETGGLAWSPGGEKVGGISTDLSSALGLPVAVISLTGARFGLRTENLTPA